LDQELLVIGLLLEGDVGVDKSFIELPTFEISLADAIEDADSSGPQFDGFKEVLDGGFDLPKLCLCFSFVVVDVGIVGVKGCDHLEVPECLRIVLVEEIGLSSFFEDALITTIRVDDLGEAIDGIWELLLKLLVVG